MFPPHLAGLSGPNLKDCAGYFVKYSLALHLCQEQKMTGEENFYEFLEDQSSISLVEKNYFQLDKPALTI
jgi:hypothetical protein